MIKPVVHYEGKARFYQWEWDYNVTIAHLERVIDHPKLISANNIRTSAVVTPINSEGRFETLNTIYEPNQNS